MMRVKGQERRVKGQTASVVLRSHSGSRPSCRGVTLVELLITMLIISILAALVLGVAAVAGQTAKEAHTRNVVTRLHTLVMEQYDTYKNRRIKLNTNVENLINNNTGTSASIKAKMLAEARLFALRETILMDMPDRWSDVLLAAVPASPAGAADVQKFPVYLAQRTELSNVYARRYVGLTNNINTISGSKNTGAEITANQDAECLYMFIMLATGDGEARSLFSERDIGDTDGDGAQEFLDAWGHPIEFLRWAPGFNSQIQLNLNELNTMTSTEANNAVAADHDPYDLYKADLKAYRLVPLIYSRGRDEIGGLLHENTLNGVTWKLSSTAVSINNSPNPFYLNPALNPYAATSNILGTYIDETATDNIHNHLLGKR